MDKVILNIADPNEIKWPRICPGCGKGLAPDDAGRPIHESKPSSMNEGEIDHVRQRMRVKGTEELLAIWVENDRVAWRPEVFDVIETILRDRGQRLPPHRNQARENDHPADESIAYDLKVRRRFTTWLTRTAPKSISITLCRRCSKRMSNAKRLARFGWGLAGVLFIAAVILRPPRNQQEMMGAAAGFWLGAILGWIGECRQNKTSGMKVVRLSKDSVEFEFRNKAFAADFREYNSSLRAKT